MAGKVVRLAEGVWRLPTVGDFVNSFVFEEPDGRVSLVDTGLRGMGPRRITAGLASLGKTPDDIARIVLTHVHFDHAGGAAGMVQASGGDLLVHEHDAPAMEEGLAPRYERDGIAGTLMNALLRKRLQPCSVDHGYAEGDFLDVGGGLRVLHTPGHTPGHCSLLHERTGVLITGDAIFNWKHRPSWPFRIFCSNVPQSRQTAERLGEADYETAAFTHGPEIRGNAREAIRDFLRRQRS